MKKDNFLLKYRFTEKQLESAGITWESLVEIYIDFIEKKDKYRKIANKILEKINDFNNVSSVKYRIKDPEHLLEKIIRKKLKDKMRNITVETYSKEITDLIGFRVTHTFKDEWREINKQIKEEWNPKEIIAYTRNGDDNYYDGIGIDRGQMKIQEHSRGYRSVHYIISVSEKDMTADLEIQVRTIYEEAWSEMGHKIIYPYHVNNEVLNNYSKILNRVSGMADEMGNFMKNEVVTIGEIKKVTEERDSLKKELEEVREQLRKIKNEKIDGNRKMKKIHFEYEMLGLDIDSKYLQILEPIHSQIEKYKEPMKPIYSQMAKYKEPMKPIYSQIAKYKEPMKSIHSQIAKYDLKLINSILDQLENTTELNKIFNNDFILKKK